MTDPKIDKNQYQPYLEELRDRLKHPKTTTKNVAEQLGLSPASIQRALKGQGGILTLELIKNNFDRIKWIPDKSTEEIAFHRLVEEIHSLCKENYVPLTTALKAGGVHEANFRSWLKDGCVPRNKEKRKASIERLNKLKEEIPNLAPQDEPGEVWRTVPWASKYQVSSHGKVRNTEERRFLEGTYNDRGYKSVWVGKRWAVARLVATLFIENPDKKPCINHKNSVRDDNRVENLEWVTRAENNAHALENTGWGTIRRKLTAEDREEMRRLHREGKATYVELAERFNTSRTTVHRILKGIRMVGGRNIRDDGV